MGSVSAYARDKWDQTKDWVRRRLGQDDPLYRHPEKAVKLYSQSSAEMSPEIRAARYNDLKAQVAYYYAKQKRDVPEKWVAQIAAIDKDYKRLKTLDESRAVLQQHGPITKATIARDLDASKDYRIQAGIDAPTKQRQHQIEFTPLKGHIAARDHIAEKTDSADTGGPSRLRAHDVEYQRATVQIKEQTKGTAKDKTRNKTKTMEHTAEV